MIGVKTPSAARALFVAAAVMAFSLLMGAAPAAAGGSPAPYGAQTFCKYRSMEVAGNTGFRLTRMLSDPPTDLYGQRPGQTVGWRILVQRRYDDGPWKRTFGSTIQRATASPSEPGVFTAIRAKIGYIDSIDRWPHGRHTEFRVIHKFFWYAADGSVERSERRPADEYHVYRDGVYQFTSYGRCAGAWLDA